MKIMKIITGIIFALVSAFIMTVLNHMMFNRAIPDFLIGWIYCTMYFEGQNFYKYLKKENNVES